MRNNFIHSLFCAFALCVMPMATSAQTRDSFYTNDCQSPKLKSEAAKWLKKGEWRQGFTAASPDKSLNAVEFYTQYQKNPEQWKAIFKWLSETDLLAISKGKHPIPTPRSPQVLRIHTTKRWKNAKARATTTT